VSDPKPAPSLRPGAGRCAFLRSRPSRGGFSLIEVLVVLGILALFALIALPNLAVPTQVPVGTTAREVAADMNLARRLAIAGHINYVVTLSPPAGPYTSYTVAPSGGSAGPDFPKTFPAQVAVTGTQQITYLPSGATTASGQLTFTEGTATAQVQVVAATGFVQVTGP
jgi:prepilin-type N-terminal cleavage/methylation domain-containing protein